MVRPTGRLTAALAGSALLTAAVAQPGTAETLRVLNWNDYIGAETIARFETETGIDVEYSTFDSIEEMQRMLFSDVTGFDVVVPTVDHLGRTSGAGRFLELDRGLIPNWRLLDPAAMAQAAAYDPGNRHGAIYLWGTTGIGYNVEMVRDRLGPEAPVDSWALLLDPDNAAALADCGITLLESGIEVLPMVLNYLGFAPDTSDPADFAAAAAALEAIRPYVRRFDSNYIDDLASGEVCVSVGWSGDVLNAADLAAEAGLGVEIAYSIPREGTLLWFDMLAIPAEAPNPAAAHAFVNFLLRPEIIAEITNQIQYPNAVPASLPLIDPAVKRRPEVYPPEALRAGLFPSGPFEARIQRLMTGLWTDLWCID